MNGTGTVSQPEPEVPTRPKSRVVGHIVRALLALALAIAVLAFSLRGVGTSVHDVANQLEHINPLDIGVLMILWALGLLTHSWVLTGSLPGLSTRRALTLNLTGSAVSNVLPLGGAFGMSLNFYMLRRWRMSATQFASYTVVSNAWNVLMKLALPPVAVAVVFGAGTVVDRRLAIPAVVASVLLALVVVLMIAALSSHRVAQVFAHRLAIVLAKLATLIGRSVDRSRVELETLATRDMIAEVVATQWVRISTAMTGYAVLQGLLLYACLQTVGAVATIPAALAAYAVDRFVSLVQVTPGGLGFSEASIFAVLVAMGGDPTTSTAGVVLYRALVAALEVPVGGVWLGWWFAAHWRSDRLRTSTS